LNIYLQTSEKPSLYFLKNPPKPVIQDDLPIFAIETQREVLRERIRQRTLQMIQNGLIDEIKSLENKYTRSPNPMKAIGIKETLDFLDGKISKDELIELISTHTAQLAKRQTTFNRTQFEKKIMIKNDEIEIFEKIFSDSLCLF
jgi:tRNA dimethylallyltransferase